MDSMGKIAGSNGGYVRTTRGSPERIAQQQKVLDRMAGGASLREACQGEGLPTETAVRRWAVTDEAFGREMRIVRQIQAHGWLDKILAVLDAPLDTDENGDPVKPEHLKAEIARRRLKVDGLKWGLAKILARLYGDKLTLANDDAQPFGKLNDEQLYEKVMQFMGRAMQRKLAAERADKN